MWTLILSLMIQLARADVEMTVAPADAEEGLHSAVTARAAQIVRDNPGLRNEEKKSLLDGLDQLETRVKTNRRLGGAALATTLGLPGAQPTLGFCLQGHPINAIELEVCAATAISVVSLTQSVKIQFDLFNDRNASGRGRQLTIGPATGARELWVCVPLMGCGFAAGPELYASLQYVSWISNHFGVSVEVSAGASVMWTSSAPGSTETMISPFLKLMVGAAF